MVVLGTTTTILALVIAGHLVLQGTYLPFAVLCCVDDDEDDDNKRGRAGARRNSDRKVRGGGRRRGNPIKRRTLRPITRSELCDAHRRGLGALVESAILSIKPIFSPLSFFRPKNRNGTRG